MSMSLRSLACSSSQRRSISSSLALRSARAWCQVANDPGWVHADAPAAPGSRVTTRVAALLSSSRSWLTISTVLGVALSCSSSHRLPGTSR